MAKKDKQFKVLTAENANGPFGFDVNILLDKETGVNYIVVQGANGISVTPRLDCDGSLKKTPPHLCEDD